MTDPTRRQLSTLLDALEDEMREIALWQGTPPPREAFESSVPFFADQMAFSEWLQWVFVARFRAIIEGGHPLPDNCQVAPMAEEALRGMNTDVSRITMLLVEVDSLFD